MIFLLLFCGKIGWAYNVDETSSVKLDGSTNAGLFGHSVAMSMDHVYVGAPDDAKHGNVFKCSTSSSASCDGVMNGKVWNLSKLSEK